MSKLISVALTLAVMQIVNIQFMAFVQREIPTELLGKIMSLITILPFVSSALGSLMYGLLFDWFRVLPWVVVLGTVVAWAGIAAWAGKLFRGVSATPQQS